MNPAVIFPGFLFLGRGSGFRGPRQDFEHDETSVVSITTCMGVFRYFISHPLNVDNNNNSSFNFLAMIFGLRLII